MVRTETLEGKAGFPQRGGRLNLALLLTASFIGERVQNVLLFGDSVTLDCTSTPGIIKTYPREGKADGPARPAYLAFRLPNDLSGNLSGSWRQVILMRQESSNVAKGDQEMVCKACAA